MTSHKIIATEEAPKAIGAYSQGVSFDNLFFFSGQIGIDPLSGQMKKGLENELSQILKNIDGLLKAVNLQRSHILKSTIFLTDLQDFDLVNKAYEDYFSRPFPARSCVEVSRLPKNAQIEIEVIAYKS